MRREQVLKNSKQTPSARINSLAYFTEDIYTFHQEIPLVTHFTFSRRSWEIVMTSWWIF